MRVAESLKCAGDDVRVLSLLRSELLVRRLERAGIPVGVLTIRGPVRALSAVLSGVRHIRRERPQVLICFDYQSTVLGRVAARAGGASAHISSIRNERFGGRRRERILALTDRLCDVTVANSRIVADSLIERRIVPAGRLEVIPNGIDVEGFSSSAGTRESCRSDLGLPDGAFVWLAVGRLWKQKNFAGLIRSFAASRSAGEGAVLVIAGDGPLRPELQALAGDLGVEDAVRFLGRRDDPSGLMHAADALVLSSDWEGLPNVVLEAFACGLPVLATRVGGVPELVIPGSTGLLAVPGDTASLTVEMDRMSSMPAEARRRLGEAGRKLVEEKYRLDRVSQSWSDLIDIHLDRNA
jgi:glycosyltransferase involved in cell wall biosynthesis